MRLNHHSFNDKWNWILVEGLIPVEQIGREVIAHVGLPNQFEVVVK